MSDYKEIAKWLPKGKRLLLQLFTSFFSYISLPFFREKEDGIRLFFQRNYSLKPDELIFDGTSSGYLSRITYLFGRIDNNNLEIIDLGCGQGALYIWLNEHECNFKQYIGIDFAINTHHLPKAHFIRGNIVDVSKHLMGNESIVFMCNSLCYINDTDFLKILSSLKTYTKIVIIEPSPNIFWDAHFCGVKPIYRSIEKTRKFLCDTGFVIENTDQDYIFRIGNHWAIELSYGIYATKLK